MARIKIPAHCREAAKSIGATTWFKSKKREKEEWFFAVDACIGQLEKFSLSGEKAENKSIAAMLAVVIDNEESLADHVVDTASAKVSDEDSWMKICIAVAWVIVQAYRNAEENGSWPK